MANDLIDRSNLTKELIDDLFEKADAGILAAHQLAQKGIVSVLTPSAEAPPLKGE